MSTQNHLFVVPVMDLASGDRLRTNVGKLWNVRLPDIELAGLDCSTGMSDKRGNRSGVYSNACSDMLTKGWLGNCLGQGASRTYPACLLMQSKLETSSVYVIDA